MNIESIFMECHGSLTMADLVSFNRVYSSPELIKKLNLPESPDQFIDYLEVDLSNIYFRNGGFFPYAYVNGFVFIEIASFEVEELKRFMVKERIQFVTDRFEEFKADNSWDMIFSLMEKKILFPKFVELYKDIPHDQIVEVFSQMWVRSESGFEAIKEDIIQYVYEHKELSPEYLERHMKLRHATDNAEYLTVYHGVTNDGVNDDLSWSLSRETAEWFASRFGYSGKVVEGKVHVDNVIDYFDWRNESEVLVLPRNVIYE